jgi:hypothetical protein
MRAEHSHTKTTMIVKSQRYAITTTSPEVAALWLIHSYEPEQNSMVRIPSQVAPKQ